MGTAVQLSGFSGAQIALIKRTVARDTNDDEFSLLMETARAFRLDPFRRQISAIVFSKDNPEKRQMAIIVSRDGYRVIASRCGDYRPASEPAVIEYNETLIGPTNPKGIVKATVRLWKRDRTGEWFPVIGEAHWDEFVPLKAAWAFDEKAGKRKPTDTLELDKTSAWARMPVLMVSKVAESQALRAGWPDQFGGVYAEEEMERSQMIDITASEIVAQEAENQRAARVGGRGILISFDPSTNILENVPAGQMADRCMAFIREHTAETVRKWSEQNRAALAQFWTMAPNDALEVKKATEAKIATKPDPTAMAAALAEAEAAARRQEDGQ